MQEVCNLQTELMTDRKAYISPAESVFIFNVFGDIRDQELSDSFLHYLSLLIRDADGGDRDAPPQYTCTSRSQLTLKQSYASACEHFITKS